MRREQRAANIQKMRRASQNVEMQIDELILHGFSVADRYVIGDAFSHELRQLITNIDEHTSFDKEAYMPVLNAGQISILPNAKPVLIGAKLAHAVYSSLNSSNKGNQR